MIPPERAAGGTTTGAVCARRPAAVPRLIMSGCYGRSSPKRLSSCKRAGGKLQRRNAAGMIVVFV